MRLQREIELPVSAARAFAEVCKLSLLEHIAWPLMKFEPREPRTFPREWQAGRFRVGLKLFGFIPLGDQWIVISVENGSASPILRDNGYSAMIPRWDHWIFIEPTGSKKCRYIDRVDIEAGLLTPFVWLFAKCFYAHRQRRWRALAEAGFAPLTILSLPVDDEFKPPSA